VDGGVQWVGGEDEGDAGFVLSSPKTNMMSFISVRTGIEKKDGTSD